MATASGIRAGKAYIELSLSSDKLIKGLRDTEARLSSVGKSIAGFGSKITGLGAVAGGSILALSKEFAKYGDDVQKASIRTGLSAEAISELGFAAQQSGTDIKTLEAGIRGMQRSIFAAGEGTKASVDAFAALGIAVEDLSGLSVEQQFYLVSDALSKIDDDTTKAALAMRIFGKSGQQLVPLLEGGSGAIQALRTEAASLGITLSKDAADNAAALTDAMGRLTTSFQAVRLQIGQAIAEQLTTFFDKVSQVITVVGAWARENQDTANTIFNVGTAVAAIGAIITSVGVSISVFAYSLGGIATAIGLFTKAMSLMSVVITAVTAPTYALGVAIAILANPITLIIAGVSALVAVLYKLGIAQKVFAVLADVASSVADVISGAFSVAVDAIRSAFSVAFEIIRGDFSALASFTLAVMSRIAKGIDFIFGTELQSDIDDALNRLAQYRADRRGGTGTRDIDTGDSRAVAENIQKKQDKESLAVADEQRRRAAFLREAQSTSRQSYEQIMAAQQEYAKQVAEASQMQDVDSGSVSTAQTEYAKTLEEATRLQAQLAEESAGQQRNLFQDISAAASGTEAATADLARLAKSPREYYELLQEQAETQRNLTAEEQAAKQKQEEAFNGIGVSDAFVSQAAVFGGARAGQIFGSVENEQLSVMEDQLEVLEKIDEGITKQRKQTQVDLAFTG